MADEPVATGTLAKTPLAHLLIYLEQKQQSGTLAVWPDVLNEGERRQDRILFLKGRPVAGRLIEPAKTLRDGLLRLFYRSEAPYAFYEANLLGGAEERLNGRIDPLSLITEALRLTARDSVVDDVLARVGSARLRMQSKVELGRFEFTPEERGVVDLLLAEPSAIAQLAAGSQLPLPRLRRLVYLLLISKSVQPYEEPAAAAQATPGTRSARPALGTSERPTDVADDVRGAGTTSKSPAALLDRLAEIPLPAEGLTPELSERWQRILARARLVENQNYFEMLGLDKNASSADAKTEFFKLVKEFHPDRLSPELAPLRPCVEVIFGYLSEAHKTLADDEQRVAYVRSVREGGGTPAAERMMQQILDSAIAYERVQVFVRKHHYDDALDVLDKILLVTKDEPDYHAMYGWVLMHKHTGNDAPVNRIMEALDRAIELHADHEKAHLAKAKMLQRLGRQSEAMRHFKRVVSVNPNNVDAAREVRIASMREEQKDKAAAKTNAVGGFLGKLLGGDKPEQPERGKKR
jgi:tetratricopeptide (TPR) repeat protein